MSGSKVHVERMVYTQVQMVCASLDIDRKELNSAAARRATVSLDAASVAKRGFLRVTNYLFTTGTGQRIALAAYAEYAEGPRYGLFQPKLLIEWRQGRS